MGLVPLTQISGFSDSENLTSQPSATNTTQETSKKRAGSNHIPRDPRIKRMKLQPEQLGWINETAEVLEARFCDEPSTRTVSHPTSSAIESTSMPYVPETLCYCANPPTNGALPIFFNHLPMSASTVPSRASSPICSTTFAYKSRFSRL
jgi:hypothetical protein